MCAETMWRSEQPISNQLKFLFGMVLITSLIQWEKTNFTFAYRLGREDRITIKSGRDWWHQQYFFNSFFEKKGGITTFLGGTRSSKNKTSVLITCTWKCLSLFHKNWEGGAILGQMPTPKCCHIFQETGLELFIKSSMDCDLTQFYTDQYFTGKCCWSCQHYRLPQNFFKTFCQLINFWKLPRYISTGYFARLFRVESKLYNVDHSLLSKVLVNMWHRTSL